MFDFFFKRRTPAVSSETVTATNVKTVAAQRALALDQAAALGREESEVVAFILGCNVADARLKAAGLLFTRGALLTVHKAMRETDRRVAKRLQHQLDALTAQELADERAQALLVQAQTLCDASSLQANQVVDLERSWQAVQAAAAAQSAFEGLHGALNHRLQSQAILQRRMLDTIATLRHVHTDAQATAEMKGHAGIAADATLADVLQDREAASLPRQLLPELIQQRALLQQWQDGLARDLAIIDGREQMLADWQAQLFRHATVAVNVDATSQVSAHEAVLAATLPSSVPDPTLILPQCDAADDIVTVSVGAPCAPPPDSTAAAHHAPVMPDPLPEASALTREMLQRQWRALPVVADGARMQQLQEGFEALLAQLPSSPVRPVRIRVRPVVMSQGVQKAALPADSQQRLASGTALEGLQAALGEGGLQRAMEQDRLLRRLELEGAAGLLSSDQQLALVNARSELARLQSWARWGGIVSREEMLATVEALPQQVLAIAELAKKVGSMRERWREYDLTSGAAPRTLWLRFDAACTMAYAPVAAHFAALLVARVANADKAQALLDAVANFLAQPEQQGCHDIADVRNEHRDWRIMTQFCQRMRQAWQHLGPLERKEQKRLDIAFAHLMQPLHSALAAQQNIIREQRQRLIDEVGQLTPQARDTAEQLQALQLRWQHHAKTFPLARQEEQLLWQHFRTACDVFFAQRKSAGAVADAQRLDSLQRKTSLCQVLEQAASDPASDGASDARLICDSRANWDIAGALPRSVQSALHARFDTAIQVLQARQAARQQAALAEKYGVVQSKLALCQQLEQQIRDAVQPLPLLSQWEQLAILPEVLEQGMRRRFDAATLALETADTQYGELLQKNQNVLDTILLQLEVALSLESPAIFQRDRLALQVVGLQSTFKAGSRDELTLTGTSQLTLLCTLPAIADAMAQRRIEHIVSAMSRDAVHFAF